MASKKKKPAVKKVPIHGTLHIADECNNWKEFLINNQYVPRVRHNRDEACAVCHCSKGEFHTIQTGCETCFVCGQVCWTGCLCEAYIESDIICEA